MTPAADFARDGATIARAAVGETDLALIETLLRDFPRDRPGVRIGSAAPEVSAMLGPTGVIGAVAASRLGPDARPVRAILFDKSLETNWSLGWHQDRTIVVPERIDSPGFGSWTIKAGLVQVEPPFAILAGMVTLRLHLDPVGEDNGPLRWVPGSHRLGRIVEADIATVVSELGERTSEAGRGDIWLYATPILHALAAARQPRRRRVLQVNYSAEALPPPLQWATL